MGRCAVVPDGNLIAPVESITTFDPAAGVRVKLLAELIVLPLILMSSITIDPVPFALNSKFALDADEVIKLSRICTSPILASVVDTLLIQELCHLLATVPKLYVLVTSGIKSLAISALIVIESVSSSPSVILPSAVIFPVTCTLPSTFKFECILTAPVPFALNSKFALEAFVVIVLPSMSIESILNLF